MGGLLLSGCVARELAWLVPRATVGFALTSNGGHVSEAGFVMLAAPLQGSVRSQRARRGPERIQRLHLLGPPTGCRIAEACRWEGRARAGTFAELAEEDELRMGGAP